MDDIKHNKTADKKYERRYSGIFEPDGRTSPKTKNSYIDDLYNTAEDTRDIRKANARILTSKDKKQVNLLIFLNAVVFAFIGFYLIFSGSADEYESIKSEARFEHDSSIYISSEAFAKKLKPNYAKTKFPKGIKNKFIPLYSENNDTVGWVRIPGTNIDHVVLQGKTNEDYSRHNFYNQYVIQGSIFMDYRNKVGAGSSSLSKNTILYGHYMSKQRTMFTELENYMTIDFYLEHPIIEMNTLCSNYKWKVIGAFIANVDEEYDNGNIFYYWYDNFSDAKTVSFANEVVTRSYFINPSVDVMPTDKFLTLSTCTHLLDIDGIVNARFVVIARLIRDDESGEVDLDAAYENPKVRMPQLWYDKNGVENPYKGVPVWDPFSA